jgi:hypothetical protein
LSQISNPNTPILIKPLFTRLFYPSDYFLRVPKPIFYASLLSMTVGIALSTLAHVGPAGEERVHPIVYGVMVIPLLTLMGTGLAAYCVGSFHDWLKYKSKYVGDPSREGEVTDGISLAGSPV